MSGSVDLHAAASPLFPIAQQHLRVLDAPFVNANYRLSIGIDMQPTPICGWVRTGAP